MWKGTLRPAAVCEGEGVVLFRHVACCGFDDVARCGAALYGALLAFCVNEPMDLPHARCLVPDHLIDGNDAGIRVSCLWEFW